MANPQVLVVEDEGIVAADIQERLQTLGYDVPATVASGEEALEKIPIYTPDVVLMDIVLQGQMDGVEAAAEIRRRFEIPVIFLTAHADESTLKRAKITEPFAYIIKPFGSIAESVGEKDASQQQAGESVTRSDRRRRELEARSSSPPLARLLLGSLAASGGTGDHTLAVANRLESPDITGSLCGLCKKSTHRLC